MIQTEEFTVHIRDTMMWLRGLARDPDLAPHMVWYPRKKYINKDDGHGEAEFWDDLDCGSDWWEIQVSRFLVE